MVQRSQPVDLLTVPPSISPLVEHGIFTRVVDNIKIHAITCGWIKYRNAHIHSVLGPYLVLLDPTWSDWVPIFSWVIEHPEGTIVVDTGETSRASRPEALKGGGMNGWLNKHLARINIDKSNDLSAQLRLLGIHPDNVRWVVLTHLHLDHAGGLEYFPKSEIIVSHQEYVRPYAFVEGVYPAWFNPKLIGHYDDIGGEFEQGHVLTRAGDVVIVPTPGHTLSHQSVMFKTSGPTFFFAGDACFSSAHLQSGFVPGINVDRAMARKTLDRIREFARNNDVVFLPSHDIRAMKAAFMPEPA
ncbi:MAG: N-acyl homoserine lactonase family protein [Cyclobacteriaceae bacterium]|nr:N-acyl homoserine lactonase family protein [Cyclobacteriaceae bacterium]